MKEIICTCPFTGKPFTALQNEETLDITIPDAITGEMITLLYDWRENAYLLPTEKIVRRYDLVSQTEATYILGVTRQRISQLIKNETIKAMQIDGRWYFERKDVLDYKEKRKVGAPKRS